MKRKTRNRLLIAVLILVFAVAALVVIQSPQSANASSYESEYMPTPQITVLTHGLADFNGASHWSNTYPTTFNEQVNGKNTQQAHFSYDYDSLIHKLSVQAGGANIYWAKMDDESLAYDLYDISGGSNYTYHTDYYDAWQNRQLVTTTITNISKHIIIVFEASDGEASNAAVYDEFEYMLDDIIDKVQALNPEQRLPKVNLVGHSRGGITNLMYAIYCKDPKVIHTMISVGTPYVGIAVPLELAGIIGVSSGLTDVSDSSSYNFYYGGWLRKGGTLSHINTVAIAGQFASNTAFESLVPWLIRIGINTYTLTHGIDANDFHNMLLQSDFMVSRNSQLGMDENNNYYNFDYTYTRYFSGSSPDTNINKRNVADQPVPHNLEAHDTQIINYILNHITAKKLYTVTLDTQGGTGGDYSTIAVYSEAMPEAGSPPTKTGYTFGGYYTTPNGGGTQYYTANMASANTYYTSEGITLYAKWIANTYTVTLNRNGGSGGSSSVNAYYGEAMPTATAPTKAGYTFGGYYTEQNGGGTQYYTSSMTSANTYDIAGNTTLYAKWTGNSYTVTLNPQNGEDSYTVTATYGETMPYTQAPTRAGYIFGGYYASPNGGGKQYYTANMNIAVKYDISGNATLYAYWLEPFVIEDGVLLEYNGISASITIPDGVTGIGDYAFSGCTTLINLVIPSGVTSIGEFAFEDCYNLVSITLPFTLTSIGNYAFYGCQSLASISISDNVSEAGIHLLYYVYEEVTLYVEAEELPDGWEDIWNFQLVNYSSHPVIWGCIFSVDKTYVVSIVSDYIENPQESELYAPYRDGYTFGGWTVTENGTVADYYMEDLGVSAPYETALYAIWIAN